MRRPWAPGLEPGQPANLILVLLAIVREQAFGAMLAAS
jgi:hypothetical protein